MAASLIPSKKRATVLAVVVALVVAWGTLITTASSGPKSEPNVVGYVGCSNTRGAVAGAHAVGHRTTGLWRELPYGGGTIVKWHEQLTRPDNGYWETFKRQLATQPATVFWVQLCIHPTHTNRAIYRSTVAVVAEIRRLVPGATVYVSPMNGYVDPHVCSIVGDDAEQRMATIVDRLVARRVARRGPYVGNLTSMYGDPSAGATIDTNQTKPDGCHPNLAGETLLGTGLLEFPAFNNRVSATPQGNSL